MAIEPLHLTQAALATVQQQALTAVQPAAWHDSSRTWVPPDQDDSRWKWLDREHSPAMQDMGAQISFILQKAPKYATQMAVSRSRPQPLPPPQLSCCLYSLYSIRSEPYGAQ